MPIVISDEVNGDYSKWFLGHNGSVYYTKKESERREIYLTKCMKYLTFLDYTALEARGKSIESKLSEKDSEMQAMRQNMIRIYKLFVRRLISDLVRLCQ